MNIVCYGDNTGFAPYAERYYAYDEETYDGAPDSSNRHQIGRGATEAEAILDLLEIMLEEGEITEDENRELMRIYSVRRGMWHWSARDAR